MTKLKNERKIVEVSRGKGYVQGIIIASDQLKEFGFDVNDPVTVLY